MDPWLAGAGMTGPEGSAADTIVNLQLSSL